MGAARKIMLLGDIGVGKTSLVRRIVHDQFAFDYRATVGVDVYAYQIPAGGPLGQPMSVVLWDTDGDLGESILEHVYCRGATAALLVGDVTRRATVVQALKLAERFEETFPGRPGVLLLNKSDLVATEGDHAPTLPAGLLALRTSARTGDNVLEALTRLASIIERRRL